jgi:hypothetical protein
MSREAFEKWASDRYIFAYNYKYSRYMANDTQLAWEAWQAALQSGQSVVPEAEALARMFHETYESLAEVAGYETRLETRSFNLESPNGRLMVLVCAEIRKALLSTGKGGE